MVYGPIAAFLVEYFPARIRYTSLSIPYHIGNGWFGGFLPLIAASLFAATGNIYAGLIYPIVVALITAFIGWRFVRETKDVRIWDEVGGQAENVPTGASAAYPEPASSGQGVGPRAASARPSVRIPASPRTSSGSRRSDRGAGYHSTRCPAPRHEPER